MVISLIQKVRNVVRNVIEHIFDEFSMLFEFFVGLREVAERGI